MTATPSCQNKAGPKWVRDKHVPGKGARRRERRGEAGGGGREGGRGRRVGRQAPGKMNLLISSLVKGVSLGQKMKNHSK